MAKMQNETLLQRKLRLTLNCVFPEQSAYTLKIHGDRYSAPGVPDIIACIQGLFIGIECKMWRGRPSEAQQLHLRDIIKAGGIGLYVVWDKEEDIYYWVPADTPFTYRARKNWIEARSKNVEIRGTTLNIIEPSYLMARIIYKFMERSNVSGT